MKPKINPAIYLDAAQLVDTGEWPVSYCCHALACLEHPSAPQWQAAEMHEITRSIPPFADAFKPADLSDDTATGWWGDADYRENQRPRVFALLFMHEIAKRAKCGKKRRRAR
jgi:hypothetical protein